MRRHSILAKSIYPFFVFLLISACGGGGGGGGGNTENSAAYIGGSGLSVSTNSLAITLDQNGSETEADVVASWTARTLVTKIAAGMPPGMTEPSWLSLRFTGDTSPITLSIGVDSSSLPEGIYQTTVRVSTINVQTLLDYEDIAVRIEIIDRPIANPTTLSFNMIEGVLPPTQNVTLARTGSTVTISPSTFIPGYTNWADRSINGESVDVLFNSNALSLLPGQYASSLVVNYDGGQQSIPIALEVSSALSAPSGVTFDIDSNSLPADRTSDVTVASNLANAIAWTATFSENWMSLSPASGVTATTDNLTLTLIQAQVDNLRPGTYTGTITIESADPSVTDIQISVTLNLTFPEVSYVSPYQAVSGLTEEVIIRGSGFQILINPAVTFGGINALSMTVVSDTEIRATHGALIAGDHLVEVSGSNGTTRSFASLVVYDPVAYQFFWDTTPYFSPSVDLTFNPERGALYTIAQGSSNGWIGRYGLTGQTWTSDDSVSDARLKYSGIALTPDGSLFYGEAISDTVLMDADTLSLQTIIDDGSPGVNGYFKRAAFANNGVMLLTSSYSNWSFIYKYDYQANTSGTLYSSAAGSADRLAKSSLDGSRIYFVSRSSNAPVLYYDASTEQLVTTAISEQASSLSVDRTGNKLIIGNNVYDGNSNLLGALPLSSLANVISADGDTAYTVESNATGVTIRKYDLTGSNGVGGFVEVGAGTFASGPEMTNANITISLDGGTLFVLGSRGFLVQPAP